MKTTVVLLSIFVYLANNVESKRKVRSFPKNFMFGASTSAYQIEGGWQEDGKSPSIWDVATHSDPSPIKDNSNGDDAADSYHLYKKDVEIAKDLGLSFYKFSIAWTRILPSGFLDKVNPLGIEYYRMLIDGLLNADIQPVITIYHGDLPHSLQKLGGWTNPLIIEWFLDYAKTVFDKLGPKVKYWITFDDPKETCVGGYGSTKRAPMLNMSGIAEYMCAKNLLMAHAKAYHLYDEIYRKLQRGSVGISLGFYWYEPASEAKDDHQAAVDARRFEWGQFAHTIFTKGGDFPIEMKKNIASKSAEQGYPRSRLPELSATEVVFIRGSADFLGVNWHSTKLAYRDASIEGMFPVPSYQDDMGAALVKDPSWTQEAPWGFFKLFMEIKSLYDNPPVYITGSGLGTRGGLLDEDRISYMRTYLNALLDALDEECDIKGYSVWSLIDCFEWEKGHTKMYGLYEVEYFSTDKTRTPRKSAFIYKEIIRSQVLDVDFEPEKFLIEAPESQDNNNSPVPNISPDSNNRPDITFFN